MIPEWAKPQNLIAALNKQYGLGGNIPVDPDTIFPEVNTCNLEEIFGTREGKSGAYSTRTSSAKWDDDQFSLVERRNYRAFLGFRSSLAPGSGSSPPKAGVIASATLSNSISQHPHSHMMSVPVNSSRPITAISASGSQMR
jgi:hypothetical protein